MIAQQVIEDTCEWAIMHGVAFRQADNSARHCPFSIAPMTMKLDVYQHLRNVTPMVAKLINRVSEDHDFLQASLSDVAKADPFFGHLIQLHHQAHGDTNNRKSVVRQPLLLMRTDYMDDEQNGAKVVEFNGIAAGMAPFGQKATELHQYIQQQWPHTYQAWTENPSAIPEKNTALTQLASGIAVAAFKVKNEAGDSGKPTFLMVIQKNEDNVYDQHLLEIELQRLGIRTVRRTFEQLSTELSSGEHQRLILQDVGGIDVVYLRAGYQYSDYYAPDMDQHECCHTLSQTRLFIELHNVAMNATISQQLATSKTIQMLLTMMPATDYVRWGLSIEEAILIKSVLAEMKPVNTDTIAWFNTTANKQQWVLKNQGEGGGHCIFGDDISRKLKQLPAKEYDAWALMQRLYPREREVPTMAIRDSKQTYIDNLVSEIGLFTVTFINVPATTLDGYAGYLVRSKPANEGEGGIHSGQGILDSLALVD
ncbi:glutathione synthase [Shewanella litoralis]|uniref:glutathione synthase n=1 Tax=Shewanella litoralis TaxID=2282700 RepID=A0ABQ2QZ66_9GAMM|nr:glutathione synthase [Shewanella litoralis]